MQATGGRSVTGAVPERISAQTPFKKAVHIGASAWERLTVADSPDPLELLRSKGYLFLLAVAVLLGAPISAIAYFYLKLVSWLQHELYDVLPKALGFAGTPAWWPVPLLLVSGLVVGLVVRYLPGRGGHSPADGFKVGGGPPLPIDLPGVVIASIATLALGAVLGPEAPLIAIGGGLGALTVHLVKSDAPPMATVVIAGAGSFAAISTLLGNPLAGAFLLMEATGLGGPVLGMVLVPGLLASGIGYMVFIGLNSWTGFGTFSLSIPNLAHLPTPTIAELGWAVVVGLGATVLGGAVRWAALFVRPFVERNLVLFTPLAGAAVAGIAIAFAEGTGQSYSNVLFSGQNELAPFTAHAATWSVGALVRGGRLQGAGLRHLAEQLPRWPDLSVVVHRGRRGHRPVAPAGAPDGGGHGHGDRRHVHRHAQASPDVGAGGQLAGRQCRLFHDSPHHRRLHRGLRGLGPLRSGARQRRQGDRADGGAAAAAASPAPDG